MLFILESRWLRPARAKYPISNNFINFCYACFLSYLYKYSPSLSPPSTTLPTTPPSQSESGSSSTRICSHSSQCIIRQPKQPPADKCNFLVHKSSKYHEHMASEEGVPARYNTHEYCMRIEYENYGCADCIWFKWWGELHGYPDINPWNFKEHLQPLTHLWRGEQDRKKNHIVLI